MTSPTHQVIPVLDHDQAGASEARCLDVFNIHLDSSAYVERRRMESEQAVMMAVQR